MVVAGCLEDQLPSITASLLWGILDEFSSDNWWNGSVRYSGP